MEMGTDWSYKGRKKGRRWILTSGALSDGEEKVRFATKSTARGEIASPARGEQRRARGFGGGERDDRLGTDFENRQRRYLLGGVHLSLSARDGRARRARLQTDTGATSAVRPRSDGSRRAYG